MHIGMQLMTFGAGERVYFTQWFPKGADNAYFTYEIIHQNFGTGTPTPGLKVEVFTKNAEDVGSEGTAVSVSFTQMGSTGFWHGPGTNLRQLVRFKITVTGGTTPPTGQEGVVYRILPPTWYDKAVV